MPYSLNDALIDRDRDLDIATFALSETQLAQIPGRQALRADRADRSDDAKFLAGPAAPDHEFGYCGVPGLDTMGVKRRSGEPQES